jgi:hypothetical protein
MRIVSSCEHATHSGGCGFWRGFGMTLRSGKSKCSPWYSHASFQNMGRHARTASSHTARLSRKRRSNGCSSVVVADSPIPNSTRPCDRRSSVETRSATRAGWFVVSWMIPCPSLMFFVRWLAAPRNTSGAELCEYSSRKWCSTSHA